MQDIPIQNSKKAWCNLSAGFCVRPFLNLFFYLATPHSLSRTSILPNKSSTSGRTQNSSQFVDLSCMNESSQLFKRRNEELASHWLSAKWSAIIPCKLSSQGSIMSAHGYVWWYTPSESLLYVSNKSIIEFILQMITIVFYIRQTSLLHAWPIH